MLAVANQSRKDDQAVDSSRLAFNLETGKMGQARSAYD